MRVTVGVVLVLVLVAAATVATGRWQGLWQDSWVGTWPGHPRPGGAGTDGPPGSAELPGRAALGPPEAPGEAAPDPARVGRAEGPATLRLACDPSGPGLSATLTVPPFAAPDQAGAAQTPEAGPGDPGGGSALPTGILVSGPGGVRSVRAAAEGSGRSLADGASLTVAGARRDEDPLRGLVPGMIQPGARITWTQDGPRRDALRLTATFPVSEAEAAALKAALGGCLARPF